ncbi:MAG: hypothetical protein AAF564_00510 [Bacteroidota bacterium]
MIARIIDTEGSAREVQLPLSQQQIDERVYQLTTTLPKQAHGSIIDFYVECFSAAGDTIRVPADAPAHVYSLKKPLRSYQRLPALSQYIKSIEASENFAWTATSGGGVRVFDGNNQVASWNIDHGLFSERIQFISADPVNRQVYIGTERGVSALQWDGSSAVKLVPQPANSWNAEQKTPDYFSTGPGVVSPLDGTFYFQVQAEAMLEQRFAPSQMFAYKDGRLDTLHIPASLGWGGTSVAIFNEMTGCMVLAGTSFKQQHFENVILQQCGTQLQTIVPQNFQYADKPAVLEQILGISATPLSDNLALSIQFRVSGQSFFGVYELDLQTEQLTPVAPELSMLDVEITALVPEWQSGQLVAATFGKGLWRLSHGKAIRTEISALPAEITALHRVPDGSWLVGTSKGVFQLDEAKNLVALVTAPEEQSNAVPASALPMDVQAVTQRVLLSGRESGLAEIEQAAGKWHVSRRWQPGAALPTGIYGDAQYGTDDEIYATLGAEGLLQLANNTYDVLGTEDGLQNKHVLRMLGKSTGELLLTYMPLPFGAKDPPVIHALQDNVIVQSIPVSNSPLTAMRSWIDVPETGKVFTATGAGVVALDNDGNSERISKNAASALAYHAPSNTLGIVGSAIEKWDGKRINPVLFGIKKPRMPNASFFGAARDVAFDKAGR